MAISKRDALRAANLKNRETEKLRKDATLIDEIASENKPSIVEQPKEQPVAPAETGTNKKASVKEESEEAEVVKVLDGIKLEKKKIARNRCLSIRVYPEVYNRISKLAETNNSSVSDIISQILCQAVGYEE